MFFILNDFPHYKGLEWPELNAYEKKMLHNLTTPNKFTGQIEDQYINHLNNVTTQRAYDALQTLEYIEDCTDPDIMDGRWFRATKLGFEIAKAMRIAGEL